MALDVGGPSSPADHHWYRFWAEYTAAQARNTRQPTRVLDLRVRRMFHDLCRMLEPTVVLELGAHEGRFSRWAKRTFPDARCLALEANPYVHREHSEDMDEIGVEYRHLAAAAANATVTINIPTQIGNQVKGRANRMASLGVHHRAVGHESVDVEAVRVDDIVDLTEDDRVVAWIDVEGASDAVLSGSEELMARADAVYIEVEDKEVWEGQWLDVDVAAFFRTLDKFPAMRDIQRLHSYNVVFISPDLAGRDGVAERAARVLRPPRGGKTEDEKAD